MFSIDSAEKVLRTNDCLKSIITQAEWMADAESTDDFEFAMECVLQNYKTLYTFVETEDIPPEKDDIISFIYGGGNSPQFMKVKPNFEKLYMGNINDEKR